MESQVSFFAEVFLFSSNNTRKGLFLLLQMYKIRTENVLNCSGRGCCDVKRFSKNNVFISNKVEKHELLFSVLCF